jgi:hypothetical protein
MQQDRIYPEQVGLLDAKLNHCTSDFPRFQIAAAEGFQLVVISFKCSLARFF